MAFTRCEGVGVSKNRALEAFPDLDYYFFLEDDAELTNGVVFPAHVDLFKASGIHHFSLFERGGSRAVVIDKIEFLSSN